VTKVVEQAINQTVIELPLQVEVADMNAFNDTAVRLRVADMLGLPLHAVSLNFGASRRRLGLNAARSRRLVALDIVVTITDEPGVNITSANIVWTSKSPSTLSAELGLDVTDALSPVVATKVTVRYVKKTDKNNLEYNLCYASNAKAEEAKEELDFKKQFLQFHFLTTAPYPRFGVYNRMQFRFPVPLLSSEYSLQSHCFRSLEWPTTETGDKCVPQKTGSFGAGVGSCILGACGPNGVNYLPEAYLTAYKHLTLELCHNDAPLSIKEVRPSVQSCQPTVITSLDAKGKISQRWSIKVHQSMVDAWANGTATSTIEKGCYTCNTVPDLPSNRVPACRDFKRVPACAIGTGRSRHFRMPFIRCFEAKGLSPGHGRVR
jgi:hypothetical protein